MYLQIKAINEFDNMHFFYSQTIFRNVNCGTKSDKPCFTNIWAMTRWPGLASNPGAPQYVIDKYTKLGELLNMILLLGEFLWRITTSPKDESWFATRTSPNNKIHVKQRTRFCIYHSALNVWHTVLKVTILKNMFNSGICWVNPYM